MDLREVSRPNFYSRKENVKTGQWLTSQCIQNGASLLTTHLVELLDDGNVAFNLDRCCGSSLPTMLTAKLPHCSMRCCCSNAVLVWLCSPIVSELFPSLATS